MEKQSCQLITERLVLRAWLESDAGVLYEYARNTVGITPIYCLTSDSVQDSNQLI